MGWATNYTHDDLGRVKTANCGTKWNQSFSFDPFGNINKTGSAAFTPTYVAGTNRVSSLSGCVVSYDANGNILQDCARGPQSVYTWDAEGHAKTIDDVTVEYDGLGRAVELYTTIAPAFYGPVIYSPFGQKLATVSIYGSSYFMNRGGWPTLLVI